MAIDDENEIIILPQHSLSRFVDFEKKCIGIFLLGILLLAIGNNMTDFPTNFFITLYLCITLSLLLGGFVMFILAILTHTFLVWKGFSPQRFIFRNQECILSDNLWKRNKIVQYSQFFSVFLDTENTIKFLTEDKRIIEEFLLSGFSENKIEMILQEFSKRSKQIQIASELRKDYTITPDIEIEEVRPAKPLKLKPENPNFRRKRKIISAIDSPSKPQNVNENISQPKPKRRLEL